MDIRKPELDGLAAAGRMLDDPDLSTALVMLTTFDRDESLARVLGTLGLRERVQAVVPAYETGLVAPEG